MMNLQFGFALLFVLCLQRSLTSPVPDDNSNQAGQEVLNEVQQLENLHKEKENSEPIAMETRHEEQPEPKPEPDASQGSAPPTADSDKIIPPQANSRSAIFRHRGITQAKKSKTWTSEHPEFSEYVKFSPTDLAEYVFRTGDEEGVAVAVEELVREGMMGRTDAINYLQDVKQELAYMKDQYEQQRKMQEMRNRIYSRQQMTQRLLSLPREEYAPLLDTEKREPKIAEPALVFSTTTEQHQQMVTASTPAPKLSTHSAGITSKPKVEEVDATSDVSGPPQIEDVKRQHAGKDAAGTSYYDEFALEEVIYQLAKDMFTQSILRGDQTAEDTLSRLITFMEGEVGKKSISPQMKEKVLEIVSAALVDSLRDYQGLLPENQSTVLDESGMYRKQQDIKGPAQGKLNIQEAYRKFNAGGQRNSHQSPSSDNGQKPS